MIAGEAMIELKGIHKSYGQEKVLEGLDLAIAEGSFTILLGPSGCGKSTILRLIAGLEAQQEGRIVLGGEDMAGIGPGDRDIAMVFQNYALYPTMDVRENIEFGLRNHRIPKAERARRIDEIAAMVGLGDYLGKKPQFLSGGQRQRVALARAMVKQPRIFLMDEPLSNLDAKLRSQLRTELIELHRRLGTTFVYVTHDQVEAMSMGTHIVLLEKGRIRQEASPEGLYARPANVFCARFIGTPPMNILPAQGRVIDTPPGAVYLGFRPEKAHLGPSAGTASPGSLVVEGEITAYEMLGSETLYKVRHGTESLSVKLYDAPRRGYGPVVTRVDRKDLFWFGEGGEALGTGSPA